MGMLCAFSTLNSQAQTADVQIIHNSADPVADSVDIYLNGAATPAVDNFKFRTATPFLQLPAGIQVAVGVAPGNSTGPGDIIATFNYTLTAGETYIIVATGVLDPSMFDTSVNSAVDIAFDLKVLTPAQMMGTGAGVDIVAIHGATDAPSVDVLANGGTPALIDDLDFGAYSGYASVPAAEYVLDITPANDNSVVVASFYADLSALGGGAAVVFASGFLNPANNMNGAPFGLFAALANGTVVELPVVGNARAQVIHNAADPAAATVDVYVKYVKDSLKLDDFAFRGATPFVDLPTGYPVDIAIAPSTSMSSSEAIATFEATLEDGGSYLIVANGVLDPSSFAPNPDGNSTAFGLWIDATAKEASGTGDVDIKVLHGATDAPSVGVNANGGAAVDSAAYGDITGYLSVPAAEYRIDVTGAKDPSTLVAPFYVDASGLGGGATLVFASGFLDPASNQNGEAFGLFAAFADGTVAPLAAVGNARAQVIHNSADPAAATVDVYVNTLADTIKLDDFAFRGATPFVDLPTGYELDIVIALPTSTDITDGVVATIPASLMSAESYHIVANGVIDPSSFAANPDGISTAFGLFVSPGAREAATGSDVDIKVFHGATDALTVDVLANGGTPPLVSGAAYTDFTSYLSVPPADYDLSITPTGMNTNVVATFDADVSTLGGGAGMILASGFLDPMTNQNGEGFGLLLVLADGTSTLLPLSTGINDLEQVNENLSVYPNPARGNTNIEYTITQPSNTEIRILDMSGKIMYNERHETQLAGSYNIALNTDVLSAGIYTIVLTTETTISVRRLSILK